MSLYSFLTNNILINTILIFFKIDAKRELPAGHWKVFKYNHNKTIQQNAGFSHIPEVEEAIEKVKLKLITTLSSNLTKGDTILDFGCGPGIYMKLLSDNYNVIGIDVSEDMLQHASQLLPNHKFYQGNFITLPIQEKFKAIYSISVLEYVPVSQIELFFKKCYDLLESGGIVFIQYPHALSKKICIILIEIIFVTALLK
jgi:cyclopropane fatty-acyl-phospholipid synthase-like methyltransferase